MRESEFTELATKTFKECLRTLTVKAGEYGVEEDRLSNFKSVGRALNIKPEVVCVTFMFKHLDSIIHQEPMLEDITHRIGDAINYLVLLKALVVEAEEEQD